MPSRPNRRSTWNRRLTREYRTLGKRRSEPDRRDETERRRDPEPAVDLDTRKGQERRDTSERRSSDERRKEEERRSIDRRSEERRLVQDLRSGQERRIEASDPDQDDRRSLGDRRETPRRKDWEDAVPILDWSPPEEEAEEQPGRHNFILMVGIVAAVALIPAIFVSIYVSKLELPQKELPLQIIEAPVERSQKQEPVEVPIVQQVEDQVHPIEPGKVRSLSHDILQISPRVYGYVKLALLSGTTIDDNGGAHRDLSTISVETIEISIKSAQWDSLSSNDKVVLLNQTFRLLKSKYPEFTEFIELKFDDSRKELRFRFDELLKSQNPRG